MTNICQNWVYIDIERINSLTFLSHLEHKNHVIDIMKNVIYCSKNGIKRQRTSEVWELLQRSWRNLENPSKIDSYVFQDSLLFPNLFTKQMNQEPGSLRHLRHMFQLKMPPLFPTFIRFLRGKNFSQTDLPCVVIYMK